jgi:hypothetical protein
MYQETAPTLSIWPPALRWTKCGSRCAVFPSLASSSGAHSPALVPFKRVTWAIIDTSAGATPARAAVSSCTSHASPVGSAIDSISIPVSLVKSG